MWVMTRSVVVSSVLTGSKLRTSELRPMTTRAGVPASATDGSRKARAKPGTAHHATEPEDLTHRDLLCFADADRPRDGPPAAAPGRPRPRIRDAGPPGGDGDTA